jgi:serine protease AprX
MIFLILPLVFIASLTPESVYAGQYWVFFRDKAIEGISKSAYCSANPELTQRAIARRAKAGADAFDIHDIPVNPAFLSELSDHGAIIRTASRWLNAASAEIPEARLEEITGLPFVLRIGPLRYGIVPPEPDQTILPKIIPGDSDPHNQYGSSYDQNALIHVPEAHGLGLSGRGVLIGMLDTGFNRSHPAFDSMTVIAEHDFQWNDGNTANESNDPSNQQNHGTMTLSVIGGYREGELIGPAYGASYALAKTEWVATETRIEEDHWVAGIEWLEAQGADVVSSSLGYDRFDDGTGYAFADMNGNTCVTTIAADIAASKGVVVVNSAGNERQNSWGRIISPADGFNVIAVGAVDDQGLLASFSSPGPTADGRIKPDVVAQGMSVTAVNPSDSSSYRFVDGTSFSCPLTAGVCALILEAHPELTPMEVRDAIRNTADRHASPDTLYGWGLVNAYKAVLYHGPACINWTRAVLPDLSVRLEMDVLAKTQLPDSVRVTFLLHGGAPLSLVLRSTTNPDSGSATFSAPFPEELGLGNADCYAELFFGNGEIATAPIGAPGKVYQVADRIQNIQRFPESLKLLSNYPNPFNQETHIRFELPKLGRVRLAVFDLLGREVVILSDRIFDAGIREWTWDGRNRSGMIVASGMYFLRLDYAGQTRTSKMLIVR